MQRLVGYREVIEDGFAVDVHALDAVLNDDGDLIGERGIISQQIRHWKSEHVAVSILMLQAFARQRRSSRRASDQEATAAHVTRGPNQVADALQSEHRVINEERNRVDAVIGIGGAGGDKRAHRPCLGDSLLENLSVLRLLVIRSVSISTGS